MNPKVILDLLSNDLTSFEIAENLKLNLRYVQKCIKNLKDRGNHKTIHGMVAHYERRKLKNYGTKG